MTDFDRRLSERHISEYARKIASAKGLSPNSTEARKVFPALQASLGRVYRAVAFDIDGTLTAPASVGESRSIVPVDAEMALIVGRLLTRGVPVILITGRGATARDAARNIQDVAQLSLWQMRRLYCVPYNGIVLWRTISEDINEFLRNSEQLASWKEAKDFRNTLMQELGGVVGPTDYGIDLKEHSVRLIFRDSNIRDKAFSKLKSAQVAGRVSADLVLVVGSYGNTYSVDIGPTTKSRALNRVAEILGIPSEKILRIGDQGQSGGNDEDLLNSSSGFSVGGFSKRPERCFPVFGRGSRRLTGYKATKQLLDDILLFPPLSVRVQNRQEYLRKLHKFEKLASIRSRAEGETLLQRLRVRMKYLIESSGEDIPSYLLTLDDLFDPQSGAVRLRDWEVGNVRKQHPLWNVFGIGFNETNACGLAWNRRYCLLVDSGLVMRGTLYYQGVVEAKERISCFEDYIQCQNAFTQEARGAIDQELASGVPPDQATYKLLLAVLDNVRNYLLVVLHAVFIAESSINHGFRSTKAFYKKLVHEHTSIHYDLLLSSDKDWAELLRKYSSLLANVIATTKRFSTGNLHRWIEDHIRQGEGFKAIFRWRETDHFLQSIAAVQLGVHEFAQRRVISGSTPIAIGLTYGGLELPCIAKVVGQARGIRLRAALLKLSVYSDTRVGNMVRKGDDDYIRRQLAVKRPVCILDGPQKRGVRGECVLVLDDNCTTCTTLQLARDVLVLQGADVVGAIIVRFPGSNRFVHMALKDHGAPDHEVLFNFIRGLVAPSPYSRLIVPGKKKTLYEDAQSIFDKAKHRVRGHLAKNAINPALGKK